MARSIHKPGTGAGGCCGNFGCPLPNYHRGLCKPLVATRGSGRRNSLGAKTSCGRRTRVGLGYFEQRRVALVVPPTAPKAPTVPIGDKRQVGELPEWRSTPCVDERPDVLVPLETDDAVRAAFAAEKAAAAAWAAARAARIAARETGTTAEPIVAPAPVEKVLPALAPPAPLPAVTPLAPSNGNRHNARMHEFEEWARVFRAREAVISRHQHLLVA
jgi:hypothetical protein